MIRRAARQYRLFARGLRNSMSVGGAPPSEAPDDWNSSARFQTIARTREPQLLSPAMRNILLLLVITAPVACIKRSAPPASMAAPATGTTRQAAAAPPPVDDYTKPNPVQEAANARIAGMARADLVGPAGLGAFKVMGEGQGRGVDRSRDRAAVHRGDAASTSRRVEPRVGGAAAGADRDSGEDRRRHPGDVLPARREPQEGSVGETEFVFELGGLAVHQVGDLSGAARARDGSRIQVRFQPDRDFAAGEAR